jgi:hypothetical protein
MKITIKPLRLRIRIVSTLWWYIVAVAVVGIFSWLSVSIIYNINYIQQNSDINLPVIHFIEDRAK